MSKTDAKALKSKKHKRDAPHDGHDTTSLPKKRRISSSEDTERAPDTQNGDLITDAPPRSEKKKKKKSKALLTTAPSNEQEPSTETSVAQSSTAADTAAEPSSKKDKSRKRKSSAPDTQTSEEAIAEAQLYLTKHTITIHFEPGASSPLIPVTNFDQLRIHTSLRSALNDFDEPTPIQACAWPLLMDGRDVIGIAETGR